MTLCLEKLEGEVARKGLEAMLGEISLKPFLKKTYGSTRAWEDSRLLDCKIRSEEREKKGLENENKKREEEKIEREEREKKEKKKEEYQEKFWNQFVVEEC